MILINIKERKIIGVIGASREQCNSELYDFAVRAGGLLAKTGFTNVCGGIGGVMEAVCKGG